jgi:hypothetical protein
MPAEILVIVLGAVSLIVVAVMEALGFLGIVGALRFRSCRRCARWTLRTVEAQPLCTRCKHSEAQAALRGEPVHCHLPHLAHLPHLRGHLLHVGH